MQIYTLARMGTDALRHRVTGRRTPMNVMLSVTNRCNQRCRYCAIPDRDQEEMSTAEILDLIDHLAERGTRRIALWGGEPLVRDDIGLIVERCVRHHFWTTLDTNGILFPERISELRAVSHVLFSLDGDRDSHDAGRGEGSYDHVMRAIEAASAEGFEFGTITVLNRHTLGCIDHVLDLAERYGFAAAFQVVHHTEGLDGGRGADFLPEDAAYRQALQKLLDEKKRGRPIANSRSGLIHLLRWPDFRVPTLPSLDKASPCVAGELFCNIDTDGSVYPCSLMVGEQPALNLRDVGFDAAFEAAASHPCKVCSATAFTEYSLLFRLRPRTVFEWTRSLGVALTKGGKGA